MFSKFPGNFLEILVYFLKISGKFSQNFHITSSKFLQDLLYPQNIFRNFVTFNKFFSKFVQSSIWFPLKFLKISARYSLNFHKIFLSNSNKFHEGFTYIDTHQTKADFW